MNKQGNKIERVFNENNYIVEYRLYHTLPPIKYETVARTWAEDQVARGKAHFVDVGRTTS